MGAMKNKYIYHSRISENKFSEILKHIAQERYRDY